MTLDQLVANLGGQLSLWAGISFLTILQAVFYFGSTFLQPGIQVWAAKDHHVREDEENGPRRGNNGLERNFMSLHSMEAAVSATNAQV